MPKICTFYERFLNMKIKITRLFALLTLIFLFVAVLGAIFHDALPQSRHCCVEAQADCTLCISKGTLSRAIFLATVLLITAAITQTIKEKAKTATFVPISRSLPMLC